MSTSCARAWPHCPRPASATEESADTGGIQRSTATAGSSWERPPAEPMRCTAKFTTWAPTAMISPLSTARSRPLRLVSSRVLAAATARASATQTRSASTPAGIATAAAAQPCASATRDPVSRQSVKNGPSPTSEATSSERTSGSGRSGSMTSRVGSSVSSPLGKNSGITAQPSASAAVRLSVTVGA